MKQLKQIKPSLQKKPADADMLALCKPPQVALCWNLPAQANCVYVRLLFAPATAASCFDDAGSVDRAQQPLCDAESLRACGQFFQGQDSAGLGSGEDVSLLGVAGSGGDDAVRLAGSRAGCEGSVSLARRTGEG